MSALRCCLRRLAPTKPATAIVSSTLSFSSSTSCSSSSTRHLLSAHRHHQHRHRHRASRLAMAGGVTVTMATAVYTAQELTSSAPANRCEATPASITLAVSKAAPVVATTAPSSRTLPAHGHTIVAGINLATGTSAVLSWLQEQARSGDEIHVVYCSPHHDAAPLSLAGAANAAYTPMDARDDERLTKILECRAHEVVVPLQQAHPDLDIHVHIMCGDPRQCLARVAAQKNADMIVVAATAKSTLTRALLGSVSSYLAINAEQTVVIVR